MQIVLLAVLWLVYLFYGWPLGIKCAIKRHTGWGERIGSFFILVPFIALVTFYVTLVLSGKTCGWSAWWETAPAFTAMVITAGIFLTSIRLFPPTFYAAYSEVKDFRTGEYDISRLDSLNIKKGQSWPIFLAIHNTSTFTWDNYRITISLPDGFEASETAGGFPNSKDWNFAPKLDSLIIGQGYVQKTSTAVLTIGETLATRFFIKSKDSGVFKLKIMVTCAGRIGERRQSLGLHVKEESQT